MDRISISIPGTLYKITGTLYRNQGETYILAQTNSAGFTLELV